MVITDPDPRELLDAAVNSASWLTLGLSSADGMFYCRTRFLRRSEQGIWIEIPAAPCVPAVVLATASERPVSVSVMAGRLRIRFTAFPLQFDLNHQTDRGPVVAVLLPQPTELLATERRAVHRVVVAGNDIKLRIWLMDEFAYLNDRISATRELRAELRDISIAGLGAAVYSGRTGPIEVVENQRLRVMLRWNDEELVLEGRARLKPKLAGTAQMIGVEFKLQESKIEDRRKSSALTRIVGQLQQRELRRWKLETSPE